MTVNSAEWVQQALRLEQSGRLADAAATYEKLLEQAPGLPDCWYNLGVLQRRLQRYDAALKSYEEALRRGITEPEQVHLNRAVIFADCLHRPEAAAQELAAALRLNPRYVPALLNRGNLDEDLGRRAAAQASYQEVIAIQPEHHEALSRLARLHAPSGPDDPLLERLREVLGSEAVPAADRASVGFALASLLDGLGQYAEAFKACELANLCSARSAGAQQPRYDHAAEARQVDQLIDVFSEARRNAITGTAPGAGGPQVIFICGMFRSGSTLVERVLAAHPQVSAGGELDLLPHAIATQLTPFPQSMRSAGGAQLAGLAAHYRSRISQLFPGAHIVTDKRPDNYLNIGLIKTLFPEAKIIHTTRNPLDVCLSNFFLHLDHSMSYALDIEDCGRHYREYRRLMAHWKSLYPQDIFDFDYDRFVREPRAVLQRLLGFCGLDWDERCLQFEQAPGVVKTASVWQVREPLYRRSSGRWQHYAAQLQPLRAVLGDLCADEPAGVPCG